ncbi:MAG: AMP-binding protein [Lautropia sp.]
MSKETDARSLGSVLTALAIADPGKPALTCDDQTLSRAELERRANRLARSFALHGVSQDDFVAIVLPNGSEFVASVFACWKIGATPLPMSVRLAPAELEASLRLVKPALVVGIDPARMLESPWIPASYVPAEELSDAPLPDRFGKAWKAILSGGSTGRPKIIVDGRPGTLGPHTLNPTIRGDDVVLVSGPMHHNAGFKHCMNGLLAGARVILMPRFDALEAIRLVRQWQVSWVSLVPTMMNRIWKLRRDDEIPSDLPSLRVLYHAGAPCPPWLKEAFIEWLGADRIFEIYGGTENNGLTFISGAEWLEHRGSVGRPVAGYRFRILDREGREVGPGEVGDIYMRPDAGPGTTYRYIGAPPCRERDGWETLGDVGYLDRDGYLYICDRDTDMILRGGANIYPAEIEAAIDSHPLVWSSAVIGLPDEDLGSRIHAVVHGDAHLSEAALREHLCERLARYKQPATIEFVSTPVRDDAGKVRRGALRAVRTATGRAGHLHPTRLGI